MEKYIEQMNKYTYIAIDQNGDVCVYDQKPYINESDDTFWTTDGNYVTINRTDDEKLIANWRNSLREL